MEWQIFHDKVDDSLDTHLANLDLFVNYRTYPRLFKAIPTKAFMFVMLSVLSVHQLLFSESNFNKFRSIISQTRTDRIHFLLKFCC